MLAVPVSNVAGTAVIGIVILAVPSKLWAVAVTPLNPIFLAVANLVAVSEFSENADAVTLLQFRLPL